MARAAVQALVSPADIVRKYNPLLLSFCLLPQVAVNGGWGRRQQPSLRSTASWSATCPSAPPILLSRIQLSGIAQWAWPLAELLQPLRDPPAGRSYGPAHGAVLWSEKPLAA
jgi:hypothetical protein